MRNQTFTTRRGGAVMPAGGMNWQRNQNTVRHQTKSMGTLTSFVAIGLLILSMGLIYVAQGTKATNYDYEISAVDEQIAELEAQKEDLAVEQARLASVATSENSTVAANMEDAQPAGYVQD